MAKHKIEYYGLDSPQYFQGASTVHTEWAEVYVGIGSTPRDAAEDACEAAEQNGFDTFRVGTRQFSDATPRGLARAYKEAGDDECDVQCYVLLWTR